MTTERTGSHSFERDRLGAAGGPLHPGIAVLGAVTLAGLAHPNPLVLPLVSAVLVVAGSILASFVALRNRSRSNSADAMEAPALMVFFGFVAAIMCDVERAVQSLSPTL